MNPIIRLWLAVLRERRCPACYSLMRYPHDFCPACRSALTRYLSACCSTCGEIMAGEGREGLCAQCLRSSRSFDRLMFHGRYEGLLRDLLLRLKHHAQLSLAPGLGSRMAGAVQAPRSYDLMVPVPLSPARLRQRGFNQALELAKSAGRDLGIPVRSGILRKIRETPSQAGLDLGERSRNLSGSFVAVAQCAGKRVLLVDDVATTCATVQEAATALKQAGAARVDVLVAARTPRNQ